MATAVGLVGSGMGAGEFGCALTSGADCGDWWAVNWGERNRCWLCDRREDWQQWPLYQGIGRLMLVTGNNGGEQFAPAGVSPRDSICSLRLPKDTAGTAMA